MVVLSLVAIALATALAGAEAAPVGDGFDEAPAVDQEKTLQGLRARIGADVDRWTIEIEERSESEVFVRVSDGEETTTERSLELRGETREERSRELATALALVIDELEAEAARSTSATAGGAGSSAVPNPELEPEPEPEPEPRPSVRAWFTVGPRVGVGRPARSDFDVGADLFAGLELLRGHLQPLFVAAVTGASRAELEVLYLHFGAGLAGGAGILKRRLEDRLWVGGGVVPRAMWLRLQEGDRQAQVWNGAASVLAIGHYRVPLKGRLELQVSLRVGADVTLPPLILTGSTARLGRGDVRALMAGSFGLRW